MQRSFAVSMMVSLVSISALAQSTALNWVKVMDQAPWHARDSQGEMVYRGQLWILGGWFNSYSSPPRDVWNSADGKNWKLVEQTAPWKHSDLPMTLVFDDKMWLMGGWCNGRLADHSASNGVWWSIDGTHWQLATASAGWSPRLAAGAAVFRNKMWILGGIDDYYFGNANSVKNDVWCSADGKEWTQVTAHAGWSPRAYHQAVVFNDKIYVLGGGNYSPKYHALNDVWCSNDGVHWTQVSDSAPWHPRIWFSAVVYRDRIWVLGGASLNPSKNWRDVWHSRDGKQWEELKSDTIWNNRHEHSAFVFQDKIWVAGGLSKALNHDVWSLKVPADYFQVQRDGEAAK